mgnify:CR=1 FL=1
MQKKQTILVVVSLLVVVLSVTLAYFTAQIIGKGKDVSVTSADLQIIFTDTDGSISGTNIEPGWSTSKTFTITNKSNETYKYNIVIQDLINTFVTEGYLGYKITSNNGGYNMEDYKDVPKSETAKDTVLAYSASIDVGVTQTYTIEYIYANDENVNQNVDQNKVLSGKLFITAGTDEPLTLADKMLRDNPTISERTDFTVVNGEDTTGTIYQTNRTEDNSTVYYYSGATTNNWVKFGKYSTTDSENNLWNASDDMYWRIIRTNEDGSVRLLYSGTSPESTKGYIGSSYYNNSSNSTINVGYMYGTSGSLENNRLNTNSSVVKTYIDTWYQNNLLNDYDKYINKSAIYCNNRSISSSGGTWEEGNQTFPSNIGSPSYKCGADSSNNLLNTASIADKFSASTIGGGNGLLTYPIALMTVDEINFAGGIQGTDNNKLFLSINSLGTNIIGQNWWTMTPSVHVKQSTMYWSVYYTGGINGAIEEKYDAPNGNAFSLAVRPVISIDKCAIVKSGDGSASNPYEIDYDNSNC